MESELKYVKLKTIRLGFYLFSFLQLYFHCKHLCEMIGLIISEGGWDSAIKVLFVF